MRGKETISVCVAGTNRKCYQTKPRVLSWDMCLSSKPHVSPYTIANQQHARNQVLLRGSCGKVAGTRDLRVCRVSQTRKSGAGQGLACGPHFHAHPRIVKVVMVFQWFSWSFQACMSAVAPPKDPGHPKSLSSCISAICHSMALYVSWNMAPCSAKGALPPS